MSKQRDSVCIFIIVIDQSLFAVDLDVNKSNVTLIWQRHTSDWREHIAGAASVKAVKSLKKELCASPQVLAFVEAGSPARYPPCSFWLRWGGAPSMG